MGTLTQRRKSFYVLSTHWDREWYESFQFYRFRLVQLLDRVLDGLKDGRLKGPFQTDGQAIILEDYLEVRPERREEILKLAREGRLVIGPWYVLPDEFIISGESHIRNIRLGRQVARDFGTQPSNAGFVCDLFGHISQLPQIFAGFGIKSAFVWRGINIDSQRHFIWEGADGTEVVAYKYCNIGYCDYAFKVRDADKFDVTFDKADKAEKLKKYLEFEASETEIDPILLFDGGDHQEWDQKTYEVLAQHLNALNGSYTLQHTSLDAYAQEMVAQRDRITVRLKGELREPGKTPMKASHLIPGVLSSRVWIKQQNADCQNTLCHWVEPISAFAALTLELPYPQGYLNVAWKHLLQNHPHDSICGCSIDQVHEDMKYRFSQCRQIGERLTLEATRKITASVDAALGEKELRVTVFNPLPVALDETVDVVLDIPDDYPTFGEFFNFEAKPAFTVHDDAGKELPYQRLGQDMKRVRTRIHDEKFPQHYHVNEVKVSLPLRVPAMGYTTLTVKPGAPNMPTRYPQDKGLATSVRSMENELISVTIEANGTLTITDKRSGEAYRDILTFEDRADIGDGWFHGVAINDQVAVSTASMADISLIENGPNVTTFRIRTTMRVPADFNFTTMRRSETRVELTMDSLVRLRPGKDHVEVETTINNTADDHRVRVLFPSGAAAETFLTDTAFDVVERPIAIRPDNHVYAELEVETKPQQSFTAVFGGKRGLAVVSTGQMESTVLDYTDRPVALTLFRGTRRTVLTNGEPNGELRTTMHFRYSVKVLRGEPKVSELFLLGQKVAAGVRLVQARQADLSLHGQARKLPTTGGFLALDGDAIMTSARQVDDTLEVRLFNPTNGKIKATLKNAGAPQALTHFESAELVNLESVPTGEKLKFDKASVALELKPKQIVTIRLS